MAMVQKIANCIRIAKVHPQPDAGIFQRSAVVVGNVDGIAKERFIRGLAVEIDQHEMQLMNMERMQFAGAVFDDPIFDRALLRDDVWNS